MASLTLNPTSGPNGTSVTFDLTEAPADISVDITFGTNTLKGGYLYIFRTGKTSSTGSLKGTITIGITKTGTAEPEPPGNYYVRANDNVTNTILATAPFTIVLTPTLVLSPTSGPPSTVIALTVENLSPSTGYYYEAFSGPNIPFTSDPTGSYTGSITVPSGTAAGAYSVLIKNSAFARIASATFTVTVPQTVVLKATATIQ
jgi:hypothetical protein